MIPEGEVIIWLLFYFKYGGSHWHRVGFVKAFRRLTEYFYSCIA